MSLIEIRHDGRRIIVPVILLPPSPPTLLTGIETDALLDTGATNTGITPRVAKQLGLRPLGKRPLGSAQGEMQSERYVLRIGFPAPPSDSALPTFPFVFDPVMAFELTDSFRRGALLGMDVLSQCDVHLDRGAVCTIRFG